MITDRPEYAEGYYATGSHGQDSVAVWRDGKWVALTPAEIRRRAELKLAA